MKFSLIKEIGIILGYLCFLFGVFYFEWEAFAVFISFVVEYFIILLIYVFLRLHPKVSKRSDEPSLGTVLIAGLCLGALNVAFGQVLIFDTMTFSEQRLQMQNLEWVVMALALPMLALHAGSIWLKWSSPHLIDDQRALIFTGVIALSAMNIGGMIVWSVNNYKNPDLVLVTMVIIRRVFEVWMNHFQKKA